MAFPVAAIQFDIEPGNCSGNRERALVLAAEAIGRGARLAVLPEACVSDLFRGAESLAESVPGVSTEIFARAAGDGAIALPVLEKSCGKIFSACAIVTRDGVAGIARKCHLYRDPSGHDTFQDSDLMAAGDGLSVIEVGGVRIGVLLGFDAEFPEAFRALALRGADVIAACLNRFEPDVAFLQGMALRNRIPIVAANRIGFKRVYPAVPEFSAMTLSIVQEKDGTFLQRCKGGSCIVDADGRVVARPGGNEPQVPEGIQEIPAKARIPIAHFQDEEILTASFRVDELRLQRLTSPYLSQRREDLYRTPPA